MNESARQREWNDAIERHRILVERFIAAARGIEPSVWKAPPAENQWSPAQVAEHIVMTYESVLSEMAGSAPMKMRTKWWLRPMLRLIFLERILRDGIFPKGIRAPREIRPSADPGAQDALTAKLVTRADEFEREASRKFAAGVLRVTHPYLGSVSGVDVVRFMTAHTQHHEQQLVTG